MNCVVLDESMILGFSCVQLVVSMVCLFKLKKFLVCNTPNLSNVILTLNYNLIRYIGKRKTNS